MYLIVGLGNPGPKYLKNRHNAGFLFLDYLIKKNNFSEFKKKDNYLFSKNNFNNEEVVLVKPQTFMNLSGNAIIYSLNYFKIDRDKIVVIYDDMDIDFGKIRIRESGSSGGHNGLKSIEQSLGTTQYNRIKIGISAPINSYGVIDYVLGDFSDSDFKILESNVFPTVEMSLQLIVKDNIKEAMNRYNGRND